VKEDMAKNSDWKERLERERKEKDKFFAVHGQSPIPAAERAKFRGLEYYPPNADYRFELELHEHSDKKLLQIEDTGGTIRDFLCWGEFQFKFGDEECTLQAYKSDPGSELLFIPFKDATSGKDTYGAGRYIDLEHERDCTPAGRWKFDFNNAYNPWCAYSKNYVCPFVPPENWLKIPVLAGEKKLKREEE
jgi:uncharacterized protein (DUF1684 family)